MKKALILAASALTAGIVSSSAAALDYSSFTAVQNFDNLLAQGTAFTAGSGAFTDPTANDSLAVFNNLTTGTASNIATGSTFNLGATSAYTVEVRLQALGESTTPGAPKAGADAETDGFTVWAQTGAAATSGILRIQSNALVWGYANNLYGGFSTTVIDTSLNSDAMHTFRLTNDGTNVFSVYRDGSLIASNLQNVAAATTQTKIVFGSFTSANRSNATLDYLAYDTTGAYTPTAIPEPSTYGLIGAGALAVTAVIRRRRKAD